MQCALCIAQCAMCIGLSWSGVEVKQCHWWSLRLQLASPFSLNSNRSLQPHLKKVAVIRMVAITVCVCLIRICLTLYLHLLCACMTDMYLSDNVFASFVRVYDLHVFFWHCICVFCERVWLTCICLTLYLHLLCACMTYMYLSAIVAAKKISFIRMMVSPAASIIQFDFKRGPHWWGLRSEIISKYHLNRAMITLFEDKKTPPPPWWPAYAMMIPYCMTSTDGPHKIIQGC